MPARTTFGSRKVFDKGAPAAAPVRAAPQETATAPAPAVTAFSAWPFLTIGLTLLLVGIFMLELRASLDPGQVRAVNLRDSVALGGVGRYFVLQEKEWWRIFTAPFLHGSWSHLIGNGVALVFAGTALERILGRAWFAALFFVGGLAGSIGSMIYGNAVVSVGASGALMCLVTVLFALSHHHKAGARAARLRRRALFVVISAFLPAAASGMVQVDYGAHFGGFAAGIALGFLLLILWSDEETMPPLRGLAFCVALLGGAITLYAAFQVSSHYPIYVAKSAGLIPLSEIGRDPAALTERSAELVDRYPHDPLARMLRSADFLQQQDYTDAEQEARTGLAEKEILATQFAPVVEQQLDILLAASLWGEGRQDEAKALATPVCASTSLSGYIAKIRTSFAQAGICG